MLALFIALAIFPQGANQARLHPADAIVMVEVPDVTKMVAAYEKAPMIAMLRDAQARQGFYGALEGTGLDFDTAVSGALRKLGMPESFASEPLAGVRHYLDGIQAASFSLSLDRKQLQGFVERAKQMKAMEGSVEVLVEAIEAYSDASEPGAAKLPKDLSELGLEASAMLDPWAHAYEYTAKDDGTYTLRSLGADGKPGGNGDNADIDNLQSMGSGSEIAAMLGFQFVIEFKNQVALDELRKTVTSMVEKLPAKVERSGPFQMAGIQAELQAWSEPESGTKFWMMRAQNMLVLGAGLATPEAFASRMGDPGMKTAADQFYAGMAKDFGVGAGATIIQGALRMADYADAMRSMVDDGSADAEFMDMFEGMLPNASMRLQLVGDRFITEVVTKYIKPSGTMAAALGIGPMPKDLLNSVPEDAIGVYGSSLDGPLMWAGMKQGMLSENPDSDEAQKKVAELEERYGFSIEKDIFGSLGKGMLMYLLPLKGVTSIPGMAFVADVEDPVALQRGIEGLMAMLGDEVGEEFKVRSKPYRDAPVWTITFGMEDGGEANPLMNAFSPSISIVKNRLLLTLNSTHIKKEIKRALGEETGIHVIATEAQRPPADAVTCGYMDWAALLNGAYEGGRGLLGLMGGAGPVPIDASKLPEPSVFTHFYRPTTFYSRTIPNGTYLRNESSFGPETWGSLIGMGLMAGFATSTTEPDESIEMMDDEEGAMTAPDGEPAVRVTVADTRASSAQATQTREALRQVATAIAVHQMDVGKYPAKLDTLLISTANYPSGFLKQGALPKDGWGHAFAFELLDAGARYRLWSFGADGLDQKGGGDDIVSP